MEMIGRVSRGSRMDQIYLPKNRVGFGTGNYVIIRPLEEKKDIGKFYFYGLDSLEPIKIEIIKKIMNIIEKNVNAENIFIFGSFLDKGFSFNDIDINIIAETEINEKKIEGEIEEKEKIQTHIIILNNKSFVKGLETDPLYQMLLSRCAARERFVYKTKRKINYKLLDLHLLKSKAFMENFDILNGNDKYKLTRNMIAIDLYLKNKKVTYDTVNKEIKNVFGASIGEIKQNLINKKDFLKKYKKTYDKTFAKILKGIQNGSKQKQID